MGKRTSKMTMRSTEGLRVCVGILASTAALLGVGCGDDSDASTSSSATSTSTGQDCPDPVTGSSTSSGEGGGTTTSVTTGAGGAGDGGAGGAGGADPTGGAGGGMNGGDPGGTGNNGFSHPNDPGESGQKDPFEILKQRADEGPPEIRSRLHGCTKLRYSALGEMLKSRGVTVTCTATSQCPANSTCMTSGPNMGQCVANNGFPRTASQLYATGKDALGVAKFDARESEAYFHTTSGATKLFDIFVQSAPEIIANIPNAEACKMNGVGYTMFSPTNGTCVRESLSCIMGRPAKGEDLILCNLIVGAADPNNAADVAKKRNIAVATFLSAAHSCE